MYSDGSKKKLSHEFSHTPFCFSKLDVSPASEGTPHMHQTTSQCKWILMDLKKLSHEFSHTPFTPAITMWVQLAKANLTCIRQLHNISEFWWIWNAFQWVQPYPLYFSKPCVSSASEGKPHMHQTTSQRRWILMDLKCFSMSSAIPTFLQQA